MQKFAGTLGASTGRQGTSGRWMLVVAAMAWLALAGTVRAQQAPINDTFTNAAVLSGYSGTTKGNDTGATLQTGEMNAIATGDNGLVTVGESVWYQWTAPANGNVTFDTLGSIDNNYNPMDTVVAAFTGPTLSTLTLAAANDNASSNNVNSSLTFYASAGTTYYVAVYVNTGAAGQPGNYVLNWRQQGASIAGEFRFTSMAYSFSTKDGKSGGDKPSTSPSIPVRATVTRVGGANGMVHVGYSIVASYYTNILITNYYTTNMLITVVDTNNNILGITNYSYTIGNNSELYQNYSPPQGFYYTTRLSSSFTSITNIYGTNLAGVPITSSYSTNGLPFVTNSPDICELGTNTTMTTDPTTMNVTTTVTWYGCTNVTVTNIVSTMPYYLAPVSGMLTFNDFEMNQDISLPFTTDPASQMPYLANPVFYVVLTTNYLDALEDQTIQAPTIQSNRSIVPITLYNELSVSNVFGLQAQTNAVVNFERATLRCDKGVGTVQIGVILKNPGTYPATVSYRIDHASKDDDNDAFTLQSGSDYARPDNATLFTAGTDFTNVTGALVWNNGSPAEQYISVPITSDQIPKFNRDFQLELYIPPGVTANCVLGQIATCDMTILFSSPPAGAVDTGYNVDNSAYTSPPHNTNPGANGEVYAVVIQPTDGKAIIGGDFTGYNSESGGYQNHIARVNTDGQLDTSFNAAGGYNGGFDADVDALILDASNNIIAVGQFNSYNGTLSRGIARLLPNGTLDPSFNPGLGTTANSKVSTVVVQPDGQILIAGNFTTYNSTNRNYIARLNPDGSVDPTFDPVVGPNGPINSIALQTNGQIVIGGNFTQVDGTNLNYIARLNADGSLDTSFNPGYGFGANNVVDSVVVQPDGKILMGGLFTQVGNIGGAGIDRLNADGSVDLGFVVGVGASDEVNTITLNTDGTIMIGGWFTTYNQSRRISLARLSPNGLLDTTFLDTAYNQFAGFINPYFDPNVNPPNPVYAIAEQADGNFLVGGSFYQVGGGGTRNDIHPRQNWTRLVGGTTPGPGNLELSFSSYTADNASPQYFVEVDRTNGTLGAVSATVSAIPTGSGAGYAQYGVDYTYTGTAPVWGTSWGVRTWMLADGLFNTNNLENDITGNTTYIGFNPVYINIISNNNSDVSLDLGLTQPKGMDTFFLGGTTTGSTTGFGSVDKAEGENTPLTAGLGAALSPLTILHNNPHPGVLTFSSPYYYVSEGAGNATITVVRNQGTDNPVTVKYATSNGTAVNGTDYRTTTGTLSFPAGVASKSFTVPLINGTIARPDRVFNVTLSAAGGGAALGSLTNAQVEIVNDNYSSGKVQFEFGTYGTNSAAPSISFGTNENSGPIQVTVARLGGVLGQLSVQVATSDGSAINGVNYAGLTNTLTWADGDATTRTLYVPVRDDGVITSNLTANIWLANATVNNTNAPLVLSLSGALTNATLVITNTDAPGVVQFTSSSYTVNENGGYAIIPLYRTGGSIGSLSVAYNTTNGTATAGNNYVATNGTLVFAPGQVSTNFIVWIKDLGTTWLAPLNFQVVLGAANTNILGTPTVAQVSINGSSAYNQPPGQPNTSYSSTAGFNAPVFALALQANGQLLAGGDFTTADGVPRNRVARLNADGTLDTSFLSFLPTFGANSTVRSLVVQDNGLILMAGLFTNYNSTTVNYFTRLNGNGTVDATFNSGAAANNPVYAVASTYVNGARTTMLGGAFTLINGTPLNSIARLLDNGKVDPTFNPGLGANATVYALAVQPDGKIVIGGDFTTVNGTNLNHIARLNQDGSVDNTFNPGAGPNASVRAIALQLDGGILIGGLFTNVNNVGLNYLARLTTTGAVDPAFQLGAGGNGGVQSIAVQPDTRILVAGNFTSFSGVSRNRITRLNPDGTVDPTINFGSGADNFVAATVIEPSGNIDLGGGFQNYSGGAHPYLVQVYGGSLAGSGAIQFGAANYQVDELGTNALISIIRTGGTSGTNANGTGDIYVTFATRNGSALAGTNYSMVVSNLDFPAGEVLKTVAVPVFDDGVVTTNLTVFLTVTNPSSPAVIGNIPSAKLMIVNDDSSVSFASTTYTVSKNTPGGQAVVVVNRQGSLVGTTTVNFSTLSTGTAVPGTDYTPVFEQPITFLPGNSNLTVNVTINNNGLAEGNRTIPMALDMPQGSYLTPPTNAVLTIIDTVNLPGQFQFSATSYSVTEGGPTGVSDAVVTVLRTNGWSGIASVNFATSDGTATAGSRYYATNGSLTFGDGVTSQSFVVQAINGTTAAGTVNLNVALSNPTGGATLTPPTSAVVSIIDNNVGVSFVNATNYISQPAPVVIIAVQRFGNTNTAFSVNYATTNMTAIAGTNYVAVSNTLNFAAGQILQNISVPLINNPQVTGDLQFGLSLSNPTGGAQVIPPAKTVVVIHASSAGLSFSSATNSVLKSAGSVMIAVVCSNPSVEPVVVDSSTVPLEVNFSTTNGTAIAGFDYSAVSGTLVFTNGLVTNYITVPIINNGLFEGNRNFNVVLSAPTAPGQLIPPATTTVTIIDVNSGVAFSSPTYTVLKTGIQANIQVVRTGYTNSMVLVNYATTNGTAKAGVNYTAVSGSLVFSNGVTVASFAVPIISSSVVQPDLTVFLQLSGATNAALNYPNFATLTIVDTSGSLVVPAGAVLVSQGAGGPPNAYPGIIYPGQVNTVNFGFRAGSGTNLPTIKATLLAVNGITPANPVSQIYTNLQVPPNSHAVSRPFTFTASGTNGQAVTPTFALFDAGGNSLGTNIFTIYLGTWTATFSNTEPIIIKANGTASPYPATINVSGMAGTILKTSVTLTNLTHGSPGDIGVLVVAPSQKDTLLMDNAGAGNSIKNVTLDFDDAAGTSLPEYGPVIVSGTNLPTSYPTIKPFP